MTTIYSYKCDICGIEMKMPWAKVYSHADVYWGTPASVHLCKNCTRSFTRWMKEERKEMRADE